MRRAELHGGLKQIRLAGGIILRRDDFQAEMECRGTYADRSGRYVGKPSIEGDPQGWHRITSLGTDYYPCLADALRDSPGRVLSAV